ncbi:MAG: M48 family metallopeptidase [Desulfobacterales bacterium]
MSTFTGTYFDGRSSKPVQVGITFEGTTLRLQDCAAVLPDIVVPLQNCSATPPFGKTGRSLTLPSGARCETRDADLLALVDFRRGPAGSARIVNFLESGWKTALACLLGLFLCIWGFVAAGIPFLAKMAAAAVPAAVTDRLSRQTLAVLDTHFLEPSEIGADRSAHLQSLFHGLVDRKNSPPHYRLEFRKSDQTGANAFALPSGLIVMTDELVGLAENDRELIGVLAHEIAHVENRHGLRILFQNAGTLLLASALAGDVSSISAAGETLPTLLIESGYSRRFEKEADRAAGMYLIRMGWGTVSLQNVLARIAKTAPIHPAFALFSTHPDLEERIGYLKKMDRNG